MPKLLYMLVLFVNVWCYLSQMSFFSSQMDLKAKFERANNCGNVSISKLEVNRPYAIGGARWVKTKFGDTVVLHLATSSTETVRVFLPRRYASLFSDADIEDINKRAISLNMIYKGICPLSKCYILSIEPC